ncbi:hypothetical protein [Streptomyces zingiberis]|uniref:hypothetical protein n=1 Tax=Streptomyces zingiberis TaxID=2053010 RepID=UPI0019D131B2|nr:hypothetical protein [Streptomyces zingiberis]
MPTYHEIISTDLSKLTTAADRWDGMAEKFNAVERQYKRDVHGISLGGGPWIGFSATTAAVRFDQTLKELQAAQTEAKAVASILRDAHTQFTELKRKVEAARDEAVRAGMAVSAQGTCRYDFSELTQQEAYTIRHDPDLPEIERSWTSRIATAVAAVDDADAGVKIALTEVVKDSNPNDGTMNGFNADAQGDVEVYEAEAVADTAQRIADGKKVSAEDLAALERALRDNSEDTAFTQTLLTTLGTDGTIRLGNELNDRVLDSDGADRARYREIQRELANSVATATTVPGSIAQAPPGSPKFQQWLESPEGKFYREWKESLDESGTKNFGEETQPLRGYQSFVSLMQHADAEFDDQFLYDLGDDLIAAEKETPSIFTKWGSGHKGIENDALDGLLAVMSRNPDAATAFLDPNGNGTGANHVGNDHLAYLLGEGDGAREWPKHLYTGYTVTEMEDYTSRLGLGAALEAATTGHPPLADGERAGEPGPHTPAQARVMQNTIEILDQGAGGEEIHHNLQRSVGRALADYAADNHNILAENGTKYGSPGGLEQPWQNGEDAGITVGKDSLMRVMRGASSDDQTYALLQDTQRMYAMDQLARAPESSGEGHESWKKPASDLAAVTGAMNSIGSDVIFDERDGKISAANDQAKYAYHVIGAPITGLPVFGDTAQRLVDAATYEWSQDVISAAESKAQEQNSEHYSAGVTGTYDLIDRWAQDRGVDINDETNAANDPNWDAWQAMRREAKQTYSASRGDAAVNLGWE